MAFSLLKRLAMEQENFFIISDEDRKWCDAHNVNVTFPGCEDYPSEFLSHPCRPGVLFYRGTPVWRQFPLMAVVGSRSPHPASLGWLDEALGDLLRQNDVAVVSGGARGVDQKAHQIALRLEKPTVVFLPSGLRHLYPQNIAEWMDPVIAAGGCFISQFLPSMPMHKNYFRERNRLIAALSPFVLLVECRRRSGTMLTAQYALKYDKTIGIMPTFPSEAGLGGLDLLCDCKATPIRDGIDLEMAVRAAAKMNR